MRSWPSSHEVWREHTSSIRFLLERADAEGGRATGSFGPANRRFVGSAVALALVCRQCDGGQLGHEAKDHRFVSSATPRVAYRFAWTLGIHREEIGFDDSMRPIWGNAAGGRW